MKPQRKIFQTVEAKAFDLESRFDEETLTEWHIISTEHLDHAGDRMTIKGAKLPPVGRAVVLLNHDPEYSGGLVIGKAIEYRVDTGPDGVVRLWQKTQYSVFTPSVGPKDMSIGELTFRSRLNGFFTDSSINFMPTKWQENKEGYDWLEWDLLEAGPVVIGMNWNTGDMKAICMKSAVDLLTSGAQTKKCAGCRDGCTGDCHQDPDRQKVLIELTGRTVDVEVIDPILIED